MFVATVLLFLLGSPPPAGAASLPFLLPGGEDTAEPGAKGSSRVYITKTDFTVQTKDTVDYVYVVGEQGMGPGDVLRVEDPLFHGMNWEKWGFPQLDPEKCSPVELGQRASYSLVTVSTTGDATLELRRVDEDDADVTSPDIHRVTYTEVIVDAGELQPGDEIVLRYGDTAYGEDCGHEFPDRSFHQVEWPAFEKLGDAADFTPVEPAPTFDVHAEDEVATLLVVVPSFVLQDEPFRVKVSPLDRWGNPVEQWTGTVHVEEAYGGAEHRFNPDDGGHWDFELSLHDEGVHRIRVSSGGLEGTSNPVVVLAEAPERWLYWGDIHVHHGHTYYQDGVRIDENHVYARDIVGLDVTCESEKGRPTEIDGEELWEELRQNCTDYTVDGSYVALLGWEWVGNYAGGNDEHYHHNIYYDDCNGPLGEHEYTVVLDGEDGLYEWVRQVEAKYGSRAVMIPHAPRYTGYDWDHQDNSLRRLVEVYSEWGDDTKPPSDVASVQTALAKGNRLGFIAGSDNHDGWLGNPYSIKNVYSGLAAFWAPELTREAIWQALHDRRTYGTTGHRSILEFWVEDGGRVEAGQVYVAGEPTFHWVYHGTGTVETVTLESVAIREGAEPKDIYQEEPGSMDVEGSYTWKGWNGEPVAVWLWVQHEEDEEGEKEQAWSSPIWLVTDCEDAEALDPAGRCATGDTAAGDTAAGDTGSPAGLPERGGRLSPGGEGAGEQGAEEPPAARCSGCSSPGGALAWPGLLLPLALLARRRRGAP